MKAMPHMEFTSRPLGDKANLYKKAILSDQSKIEDFFIFKWKNGILERRKT